MSKKRGALSEDERQLIHSMLDIKTDQEIAKLVNRTPAYIKKMRVQAPVVQQNDALATGIEKLHKHYLWPTIKKALLPGEEEIFEQGWVRLLEQFAEQGINTSDEMLIKDLLLQDIWIDRIRRDVKSIALEISAIQGHISLEMQKPIEARDNIILTQFHIEVNNRRGAQHDMQKNLRDMQQRKEMLAKQLNMTREARFKNIEESKINFFEHLKDLSSKTNKPSWVYLSEEQIKKFFNNLLFDYRVLCWLMYDSGMRVTEANSIQVQNFSKDFTQLDIPDEVSKTFGRTINLKICSAFLKEYIKEHKLKPTDYIVQKDLWTINKYLKDNCGRMFGKDKVSSPKSKGLYGNFTLYSIRHNSCCYWSNRYPTHKGLMYRFGWRKADKIECYSEFLGVRDELSDSDMITAEDKPKLYQLEEKVKNFEALLKKYIPDLKNVNELLESKSN